MWSKLGMLLSGLWGLNASAFVLLNGLDEARLPVTPSNPAIVFYWNGVAPNIDEKEKFAGGVYQNYTNEEFFAVLLEQAAGIWNGVRGSFLEIQIQIDPNVALDSEDLVYGIVTKLESNVTSAAAALPMFEEGVITDCDIKIADRKTEAKQLAYTIAHELGHCLGLGHAHSSYNAMMGYSRDKFDLSLGVDDKAGLIYLYPDPIYTDGKVKELAGCGVVGRSSGGREPSQTATYWLLLALGLLPCCPTISRFRGLKKVT
jgi:hypothetical protein